MQGSADMMQPSSIVFNKNHGRSLFEFCMQELIMHHHDNDYVCSFCTSTEASAPAVLSIVLLFFVDSLCPWYRHNHRLQKQCRVTVF